MVVVSEVLHKRGLDFKNQRKVVILRDQGKTFVQIASEVKNLQGGRPDRRTCANYYTQFHRRVGRRKSNYKNCGRKPWKLSTGVKKFLVTTLLKQRKQSICTAATLQAELARQKGVIVEMCTIRKYIKKQGYRWLPRGQKRKYTQADMADRLAHAQAIVRLGEEGLRKKMSFSMDGCVLPIPPSDPIERINYLRHGQTHMWRKKSERLMPELAGEDHYANRVRIGRAVPLWGGLSAGGFAPVLFHKNKKLDTAEWAEAAQAGKLTRTINSLHHVDRRGPWYVLSDNESFIMAPASRREYRKLGIRIWKLPRRSPDLNPIERFWAYLRKRLKSMDLNDAVRKKPVLGKLAYTARIRAILRSPAAQEVAKNIGKGYLNTCKEVVRSKGAASSG